MNNYVIFKHLFVKKKQYSVKGYKNKYYSSINE